MSHPYVIGLVLCVALLPAAFAQRSSDDEHVPYRPEAPSPNATAQGIHRGNVGNLSLVWTHQIGPPARFQARPAVAGDRVIVSTGPEVMALDGSTGATIWSTRLDGPPLGDAGPSSAPRGAPAVRGGVAYVAHGTRVHALDVVDGDERWSVDVNHEGLAEQIGAHPTIAGDRIVVGTGPLNRGAAPGRVVAIDAAEGSILWTFFVVPPSPDAPGYDTWRPAPPDWRYGIGGGGVTNHVAYDALTETLVFGTGTPSPQERLDARRRNDGLASADLFTSSVVAVDAVTGALRWYVPIVPGDEWGYDQGAVPSIVDVSIEEARRRVVLYATSTGYLLVIALDSGDLLRAHLMAPESNVHVGYDEHGGALIDADMRYLGDRSATRVCPAPSWSGVAPGAFNEDDGLYYRSNEIVCVQMGQRPPVQSPDESEVDTMWLRSQPRRLEDYYGRWGALTAIDPVSGRVRWEVATQYPHDAGVLVTAGEVVFSAFADRSFRAFDATTGDLLWSQILSAHSEGSPVTYAVDGMTYVVIAVGHPTGREALPESRMPDSVPGPITLFAFALRVDDR